MSDLSDKAEEVNRELGSDYVWIIWNKIIKIIEFIMKILNLFNFHS